VQPDTAKGDDDADECRGVLGEHRARGRIRRLQRVREQVTIETVCLGPQLPDGLEERDSFQYKGNGQHDIGQRVITAVGLLTADELAEAVPDRHRRADDEQANGCEQ
jgi:hypothetical protein